MTPNRRELLSTFLAAVAARLSSAEDAVTVPGKRSLILPNWTMNSRL
jgi:hypothetical protein